MPIREIKFPFFAFEKNIYFSRQSDRLVNRQPRSQGLLRLFFRIFFICKKKPQKALGMRLRHYDTDGNYVIDDLAFFTEDK